MSVFEPGILELAERVVAHARAKGVMLGCVESCTGGLVGAAITAVPGSSEVFVGGLVTYSDEVKHRVVGVSYEKIEEHGAVSSPVAAHMAMGGLAVLGADRCVSVTGIAGPGGGTEEKPVGTVWVGLSVKGELEVKCGLGQFEGDRESVRMQSVEIALGMLDPGE